MTPRPVISSLSSSSSEPSQLETVPLVQNNASAGHLIKCAKCDQSFKLESLVGHLKEHTTMGRGKAYQSVLEDSKAFVKLSPMGIEIKRKRHGSKGDSCKRIKLQDGETELSVDPTVDKVKCKSCKPTKFFPDIETLRYHLIASHGISAKSSYYVNPSLSPAKPLQSLESAKKVRVKSPSEFSEMKDVRETEDKELESTATKQGLEGSFREVLRRRTKLKRSQIVNSSISIKAQPPCTSEKVSSSSIANVDSSEISKDASGENVTRSVETSKTKSSVSSNGKIPYITSIKNEVKEESGTFAVPAPVKEGRRSGKLTAPSSKTEKPTRRRSERRFEGIKPFKCNHCELSYSSLENKKLHEATHTDKIHLCMYCEMRFYFPLCLKRHYRIHKN